MDIRPFFLSIFQRRIKDNSKREGSAVLASVTDRSDALSQSSERESISKDKAPCHIDRQIEIRLRPRIDVNTVVRVTAENPIVVPQSELAREA